MLHHVNQPSSVETVLYHVDQPASVKTVLYHVDIKLQTRQRCIVLTSNLQSRQCCIMSTPSFSQDRGSPGWPIIALCDCVFIAHGLHWNDTACTIYFIHPNAAITHVGNYIKYRIKIFYSALSYPPLRLKHSSPLKKAPNFWALYPLDTILKRCTQDPPPPPPFVLPIFMLQLRVLWIFYY